MISRLTKLVLCDEPLLESKKTKSDFLFAEEELKIENAHEIANKASLSGKKSVFIAANFFNEYSQNALLKTLEEPPDDTNFTIFAKGKNYLLKTILSRVAIEDRREVVTLKNFPMDINSLNFETILEFISTLKDTSRAEVLELVYSLLAAIKNLDLKEKDLEKFEVAIRALKSHHRPELALLPLLLLVMRYGQKNR